MSIATRRREYSARAATFLRNKEVEWLTGDWLKDLATGESCDSQHTMGFIRQWIADHRMRARNRRCGVCAEGALLLALAEDPTVPDDARADNLLMEFQPLADIIADKLEYGHDTIPEINDESFENADDAMKFLDEMANY